ncbi:E3 ubiquitin-protein ligase bre1 [Lecanora helva]
MEERKRRASHDHEGPEPPLKRQATTVNGASKTHVDADMPWKDDLEKFQKEAIVRQMQEYKRERNNLEAQLNTVTKSALHHDEHLMMIDACFSQLVDEIKLMVGDVNNHTDFSPFPTALLKAEPSVFQKHLNSRSTNISSAISQVFKRSTAAAPEVIQYQERIAGLLAVEKAHIVELEKTRLEKDKIEQRLEDASLRYMLAEKKLDRSKSATVAKLEKQAIAGGRSEAGSGLGGGEQDAINGQADQKADSKEELSKAEEARKEAIAESAKRKEQIESLESDNAKLTTEVEKLKTRISCLSDDDWSRTDLFKHLKSQHDDVIKNINDLTATNVQLREQAQKEQTERTAYRVQLEKESQAAFAESKNQIAQLESDLARVRSARDELIADQSMRKSAQSQERTAIDQVRDLANAKEERIKALESEIARLRVQNGVQKGPASPPLSIDGLSQEELQERYTQLEKQFSLLTNELQSMESAYKKTSTVAQSKVTNTSALEEKAVRLSAEKARADQKYFAAMKAKEAREQEVRTLRAQNSKSSEMVSSLKESESANRALQVNLEKQIADFKESITSLEQKCRTSQQQASDKGILLDNLKAQIDELKKILEATNTASSNASNARRTAEVEIEALKVRLEETKKSLESWKTKGLGNQSGEYEMLRMIAICTVCHKNFKNTAIKTCGHVFCNECVEERTSSRSRKCPNCGKSFGNSDAMRVTL